MLEPKASMFRLNLGELWRYKDLILLFVKRDFTAVYKQTILGPLWHIIQPLFTTAVYVAFGGAINIQTDDIPRVVFCLSGVILWNYFSSCLTKTSSTFVGNVTIFGKVYFPRLVMPVSIVLSNLVSLGIQLLLLVPVLILYRHSVHISVYLLALPLIILVLATLGLGVGLMVSSLTIKYRDLTYFVAFAVQLAVFATPIMYPFSYFKGKALAVASLNPVSPVIEFFRFSLFGQGTFTTGTLLYSVIFSIIALFAGILMFNRVEGDFMDTV